MSMNNPELARVALTYPAIDNHAHPLLREQYRNSFVFEGLISEASPGPGLTQDATNTLACYRATLQLGKLFGTNTEHWEDIKQIRQSVDWLTLCRICMEPTRIQCLLLDDGLGGVAEYAAGYKWHDQFTQSPTKRIVRVEVLAEGILKGVMDDIIRTGSAVDGPALVGRFKQHLHGALSQAATDPEVVGFKSIACYRAGLDIDPNPDLGALDRNLVMTLLRYEVTKTLRLSDKAINDVVVNMTLRVAGECGKPVQFHTGLGDNDITLSLASPALMQPIIKAYPNTKILLLHSGYPYTREAGYLTAVYPNVYLDFGEIFPFLSADGQRSTVKQVLELCPTNKILWSTDGHWWPESYYLGSIQARQTLFEVLSESINRREMSESHAIAIIKRALFENANKLYNLNLQPYYSG
ncbi:unnamed protein product [Somion occarium]|uniref:Amidohydrolase-related domain-containing protein n=1 Tax=Somion occarium TaxID=3059160 RepID=A0ABP1CQB0_9APHY